MPSNKLGVMGAAGSGAGGGNQLWSWGGNTHGQLGLGDTTSRSSPVQVGSDTDWTNVGGGEKEEAVLATKSSGELYVWGNNRLGALGLGDTIDRSSPVQLGSDTDWGTISSGSATSGSVKTDGTLWCWGNNGYGQVGTGNTTNYSSPVQVGSLTDWLDAQHGNLNCIAVKTDGTLWSWGRNHFGQLGLGNTTNYSSPVQVGSDTNWSKITVGADYCIALKTNGTIWSWGRNVLFTLGLGDSTNRSVPVQIGSDTDWSVVSNLSYGALAVKDSGALYGWGYNGVGQLGTGDTTNRSVPVQLGADKDWLTTDANSITGHGAHRQLTLTSDNQLWVTGENTRGELGLGDTTNRSSPVQVGSDTNWIKMGSVGTLDAGVCSFGIKSV